MSTPIVTAPAWEVHVPVPCPQLLARPLCCARVLQQGLLAAPLSDLQGPLFLGKFLEETQTVTELCGFGKGTGLPYFECTASATLTTAC